MAARKGGMATGIEVARISVKVSPDTSEFRRELRDQLKDHDGKDKDAPKVKPKVDTKEAEKKLDEVSRDRKVDISTDIKDTRGWQEKLRAQAKELRSSMLHGPEFDKNSNISGELERVRYLLRDMDRYKGTFKQDLGIDARVLRSRWETTLKEIEGSLKGKKIKVDVDVEVNKRQDIFDRVLSKIPGFGGGGRGKPPGGVEAGGGLPFPMPSFGTGINPAGWAVILAGITVAAGPLIGLISSTLMSLPGLLASVMAPIGAVALGMKGIGEAAAAAGLTEQKVGKKGKVKTTVGQAIQSLQDDVSNVFKSDLVPVFQKVIGIISDPGLHAGFETIAGGLSKMADGFVSAVSSSAGMQKINATLTNIGTGLGNMQPGIQSFTSGLLGLAEQFTAKFPAISEWFNKSMAGFDQWVSKVSADGSLSNAFDGLGHTVEKIMSTIADLGKKGIEFMGDPQNIKMIDDLLDGVHNTLNSIMDVSEKIAGQWDTIKSLLTGGNILSKITQGDLKGAWDAFKESDLGQRNDYLGNGQKAQVDALTKSAKEAGAAAADAHTKVQTLVGSGAPKSLDGKVLPGGHGAGGGASTVANPAATEKVTPPDTTEAIAAIQKYKDAAGQAAGEIKQKLSEVGQNIPAPNFDSFKSAFDSLPQAAEQAMRSVAQSITAGGAQAVTEATAVGMRILEAIKQTTPLFQTVGFDMMAGLANGITAGSSLAITAAVNAAKASLAAAKQALDSHSPSRKFMELGNDVSKGLAIGIDQGIGPVTDQAKDMADKVSKAFADGSDPTTALAGFKDSDIKRMEKVLSLEMKRLEIQAKALDYQAKMNKDQNAAAQAKALRDRKEELGLQKDMVDLTNEYNGKGSSSGDGEDPFAKAAAGLIKAPGDFAAATGKQFLSDLGINGNGMIGNAITEGIKYVFNISSVDEALSIKDRQDSKQAMSVIGR